MSDRVKPLSVAIVTGMGDRGGTETQVLQIARYLDSNLFEPFFLVPKGGKIASDLRMLQKRVYEIPMHPFLRNLPAAVHSARSIFLRETPALVHCHTTVGGVIGRIAAFMTHLPVIYTHHGFGYRDLLRMSNLSWRRQLKHSCMVKLEYFLDSYTDAILCVCHSDYYRGTGLHYFPHNRVAVAPNGIEIPDMSKLSSKTQIREQLHIPSTDLVFGTVARMVVQKGLSDLLVALRLVLDTHPHLKCMIIGGGPEASYLMQTIKELNLDQSVILTGEVDEPMQLLPALDIFVSSSWWEGFPYAILEAAVLGLPIIATSVGGVPELLPEGAGILIPPKNTKALARAIIALADNQTLRTRMGINVQAFCSRYFTIQRFITELQSVYKQVMKVNHVE